MRPSRSERGSASQRKAPRPLVPAPAGQSWSETASHNHVAVLRCSALRLRVAAAFFADADRAAAEREADARPPSFPPLRGEAWLSGLPRPDPLFLPPPLSLLTVAQARLSASFSGTPRDS